VIDGCARACLPRRAMVVDDSKTMRAIVRKVLNATRFNVDIVEAEEGNAALELLNRGGIDIVFLDYNMPGRDGLETLADIRRLAPQTGVFVMSSTRDDTLAQRVRAAGADGFLKKPFYPVDVDAVLHTLYGLTPVKRG
jgi:CheY-like chemotaxis protein